MPPAWTKLGALHFSVSSTVGAGFVHHRAHVLEDGPCEVGLAGDVGVDARIVLGHAGSPSLVVEKLLWRIAVERVPNRLSDLVAYSASGNGQRCRIVYGRGGWLSISTNSRTRQWIGAIGVGGRRAAASRTTVTCGVSLPDDATFTRACDEFGAERMP